MTPLDLKHRSGTHPAVLAHERQRAASAQLRLADAITALAGSMPFVYLHIVAFAVWMLVAEHRPWATLTLVVSLEAIFLSTFVMIGQNRQAGFQQAKADHDFREQELELKLNTEITREIHALTSELMRRELTQRQVLPTRLLRGRRTDGPWMTCTGPVRSALRPGH
ncbi:DUF1003 domain-containing protein [Sporichthya sp.]|uniref:DUF1003 domain-containing protein n=1 Tax=Sporichthya sp. TaxID=65475 RepID=UPI0017E20074|nr:DUF1003 domain-containing protein [Sporichthya sp.]MBA3742451.1 DUF1003 domain-containing protein [Sporichthya sp.]